MSSDQKNRTASDSLNSERPIHTQESDVARRVKSVIEEYESVSAFARRCGVGESTLRNIMSGAIPHTDNLVAIADAGGVTVDWLATGRPPRDRSDLQAQYVMREPTAMDYEETSLLADWRRLDHEQKRTIRALLDALVRPSFTAWMKVGELVAKTASIFDRDR